MSSTKHEVTLSRMQFAERMIYLEGNQFSLHMHPMFRQIYQCHHDELLLRCGRQVGKTITESCLSLIESVAIPGFRTLYVSPSQEQTRRFSISKLGRMLRESRDLKSMLLQGDWRCNVGHHMYGNSSEIYFSYAGDDADRIRGLTVDRILVDEVQDMDVDVLPIIKQCARASDYRWFTATGTPKTLTNTIEHLWVGSNRQEWCIKCTSCNRWNYYIGLNGMGKKGIVCHNCGRYVNPYNGVWVATNKRPLTNRNGYHIPQLIMPDVNPITAPNQEEFDKRLRNWKQILMALESGEYSETTFLNEIIGVSTQAGASLFTYDELAGMCNAGRSGSYDGAYDVTKYRLVTMGIDWSGGGLKGESRTACTVWGLRYDGQMDLLYFRRFPVENPLTSLYELKRIKARFGVKVIGADAGGGTLGNAILRQEYGHDKVFPFHYGNQRVPLLWDSLLHQGCYKTDRTTVIDEFSLQLKQSHVKFEFPREERCEQLFRDYLNVFESVTKAGKKVWERHAGQTDDLLHASVYGWLACRIATGDLNHWLAMQDREQY